MQKLLKSILIHLICIYKQKLVLVVGLDLVLHVLAHSRIEEEKLLQHYKIKV